MRIARAAAAVAVIAAVVVVLSGGPAAAGGGCHRTGVTEGRGDVVEMVEMCLSPAVLHVEPGTTVTFVNRDIGMEHNVSGTRWYDDLPDAGDSTTRRFDTPGVVPYSCTLHPGMNGAIVVDEIATPAPELIAATSPAASAGPRDGVPVPATVAGGIALAVASIAAGRRSARSR